MQSVHALGPTSQLAKTWLGLLAAGYFESTTNDFGGGGRSGERELLKRSIIIQLFFPQV